MPGESRSPLKAGIARELGCSPEVIRTASHDTASAVAAVPAAGGGGADWAYISSGTWSLVGMELDSPVLSPAARAKNFTNEGGVAGTIRFLRNVSGLWILQELRRIWRERDRLDLDWADIVAEAEAAPPHAAFINPDAACFVAPDDMAEAVAVNCRASGQAPPEGVGPTARCVFESLAFAYRRALDDLEEVTGRDPGRIHVVGGGSQNRLLCRLAAEACGRTVLAGPAEATALGNMLVQAIALGAIGDLAAGRELIAKSFPPETIEPEGDGSVEAAYERFRMVE